MNKYFFYAVLSYVMWGVFPIFWKQLSHLEALEILSHRIIWSSVVLSIYIFFQKRKKILWLAIRNKKILGLSFLGAVLLGINWLTYVWAINNDKVIDSSLGYFICPLVSVLFGRIIFKERLDFLKKVSVLLALLGVLVLTINAGTLPWIALILSLTFGVYGAIKKITKLEATRSLWLETTILSIPALFFIIFHVSSTNTINKTNLDYVLLFLSGFVTFIPLLFFSFSATKISLSTLGFMQYIAPTGQFLIGLLVYNERFTFIDLFSYSFIWTGLILFTYSLYKGRQKIKPISI